MPRRQWPAPWGLPRLLWQLLRGLKAAKAAAMKAVLRVLGASWIVLVWPAVRWIVMLLGGLFSIALWELAELGRP